MRRLEDGAEKAQILSFFEQRWAKSREADRELEKERLERLETYAKEPDLGVLQARGHFGGGWRLPGSITQ